MSLVVEATRRICVDLCSGAGVHPGFKMGGGGGGVQEIKSRFGWTLHGIMITIGINKLLSVAT